MVTWLNAQRPHDGYDPNPFPGQTGGEDRLVARGDQLEVADRERRPAEEVDRAHERRQGKRTSSSSHPRAAASIPSRARRRDRRRAHIAAMRRAARAATTSALAFCACSSLAARCRRTRRHATGTSRGATVPPRGRTAARCSPRAPGSRPGRSAHRASSSRRRTPPPRGSQGRGLPPPTEGGRVSRPTVEPRQPRLGDGPPGQHRPRERDLGDRSRHRPDRVERRTRAGRRPSIGIRPHCGLRPTVPQHADGSRIEQPVSVPSPRSHMPAASAAALPPDEPPVVLPGRRGIVHGAVPLVLARHAPRELVQIRLADDDGAGVDEPLTGGCSSAGT